MISYRYIPVWRREAGLAKLYRCFEILGGGGYVVQSADYFYPHSDREHAMQLERQFLELLLEARPEERSEPRPSIEEAIQDFEASFDDDSIDEEEN